MSDTVQDALWKNFDVPYFLRHDAQEIAWHARMLHSRTSVEQPVVKARLSPAGEGLQAIIYVRDQKDLFARICGYFGSVGLSIVDAKIYHRRLRAGHLQVMDVSNVHPRAISNRRELAARLAKNPAAADEGRVAQGAAPIAVRIVPTKGPVSALSICGRPHRLLYAIALVLSRYGISLHNAKIVTLGERAEDVLVVSGAALSNPKTVLQFETDLLAALQPQ
jgi:[protein-PII] uridylyltransferase